MRAATVVHLAWGPLGIAPLAAFAAAHAAHAPGREAELLVVWNGFGRGGPGADARGALGDTTHRELVLPEPVQDLPAYRAALEHCAEGPVCFVNSYARPAAAGWLQTLLAPLERPGVGLVGASGSWESAFSSAPLALRWPRWRGFRPFPNPALRTNAWGGERSLLVDLDWTMPPTKLGALELESGRRSLTRQVRRRGLQTVVVGRDGEAFPPRAWARSGTFRAYGQRNLLVHDNRTDDWARADPAQRRRLTRMAWGRWPDRDA